MIVCEHVTEERIMGYIPFLRCTWRIMRITDRLTLAAPVILPMTGQRQAKFDQFGFG